jgi:hypothetical protein
MSKVKAVEVVLIGADGVERRLIESLHVGNVKVNLGDTPVILAPNESLIARMNGPAVVQGFSFELKDVSDEIAAWKLPGGEDGEG